MLFSIASAQKQKTKIATSADKILRNTPMGRFGESNELVGGVFFLADSTLSSFVNGVVLPIDGGFAAYSGV